MLTRARTNPLAALLMAALAVGTLGLAACTGSEPAAPTPTAAPPKAATPAATTATTPAATAKAATTSAATPAASAAAAATTVRVAKVNGADALVDGRGMTLYIFKNDAAGSGKSVCNGGCAANWPPLKATDAAPTKGAGVTGALSVITRDDGTKQVAYQGLPLYFYTPDTAAGDAKGAAIPNWAIALP